MLHAADHPPVVELIRQCATAGVFEDEPKKDEIEGAVQLACARRIFQWLTRDDFLVRSPTAYGLEVRTMCRKACAVFETIAEGHAPAIDAVPFAQERRERGVEL